MKRFCAFGIAAVFALAICVTDANGQCDCNNSGTVINAPVVQSAPVANYTYQPAPVSNSWNSAPASDCCTQNVVVRPRRRMFTSRRAANNCCPPTYTSAPASNYCATPAYTAAPVSNCGGCATASVMATPAPVYTSGCNSCGSYGSYPMTSGQAGMSYPVATTGCAGCASGCGQSMISGNIISGSGCASGCGEVITSGQVPAAAVQPTPTPDANVQPESTEATPPTPDDT